MRIVVVGHGMVGSRFVEEVSARARPGTQICVLGAEEYEPYNRVLLSEVVAGAVDVASLTLPPAPGADGGPVEVHRGASAHAVDRGRRLVRTDAGDVPYDHLVLATGAEARVPPVTGLAPLPAGVHALRSLDDAREIVAATVNRPRAIVLGGGVLGLEAACGLARRGLQVTVLHGGAHLMDRQLDATAAAAVTHGLAGLGIVQRTDALTEEVLVEDGRLRGVRLADGEVLPAELLVLTAGTVPRSSLAATAGLEVARGVVVDAECTTSDPRIHAIGDCAEPPEGGLGLVAQGWDQARRLATRLTDAPSGEAAAGRGPTRDRGTLADSLHGTDVVRLKAHGIEVAAMGTTTGSGTVPTGARRLTLSDPDVGRHVEVVVAQGVVVGVTCVGAGALTADLTAAYTRRTPVPADPAQLLLRPVRGAPTGGGEPSPTLMPDRATVCRCNGVTKGDIVSCWEHGARSTADVARATRATTGCGGCREAVCGIVDWLAKITPKDDPATVEPGNAPQPARVAETDREVVSRT